LNHQRKECGRYRAKKNQFVIRQVYSGQDRLEYLPPYSPDYNSIEPMWSKVKEVLRAAAQRTLDELGNAVSLALASVTANDCRGFYANSGYAI
jgi:transposase